MQNPTLSFGCIGGNVVAADSGVDDDGGDGDVGNGVLFFRSVATGIGGDAATQRRCSGGFVSCSQKTNRPVFEFKRAAVSASSRDTWRWMYLSAFRFATLQCIKKMLNTCQP